MRDEHQGRAPFAVQLEHQLDHGLARGGVQAARRLVGEQQRRLRDKGAGEIVGLIFDGNIESLVGRFVYDDTANRAVAVHTAAMTEALTKLYDADELVKELLGK